MATVPLNDPRNQVVTVITVSHRQHTGTTFCDAPKTRIDLSGIPSKSGVRVTACRLA